ncbi:muts domain V [Mollisia scopiformis]|uniref:Muts domain V n=1 Tax=Mollisia scopiformis TaxID=149040 RepID=A0A194XPR4_MOLSC|nr:muts domain V [Mollisia scopiformis]KUJ22245.1 muts domain V [Mollisia scopiformis]
MLVSSRPIRVVIPRSTVAKRHLRCLHQASRPRPQHAAPSSQVWRVPKRGKRTQTSLNLHDLPQSSRHLESIDKGKGIGVSQDDQDQNQIATPLEPLVLQDDTPSYPTVILQARNNMRKFENCVLLTRVGGFYEMYFEHAEQYGPQLNLKVAEKKTSAGLVPMAGFPIFQLDRYLKILVQDFDRYVAIAEEFPNDASGQVKAGGLMHDRRVSRVVTPGTLIDENFMDPFSNNYVLAIYPSNNSQDNLNRQHPQVSIGLAWLDLSTGHFFTQSTTLTMLPALLARIGAREIVLAEDLKFSKDHEIFSVLGDDHSLITYIDVAATKPLSEWAPMLESPVSPRLAAEFTDQEIGAGSILIQYVESRLLDSKMKLQPPSRQLDVMGIDKNTMRALEVRRTMRDGSSKGSLLHTIRRTVTKGGARLLEHWLSSPSTSVDVIDARLDLVTYMLKNEILRERLLILLKRSHDSHRLLQKFAFGRGDADDLLALTSAVFATRDLVSTLQQSNSEESCVQNMISRINLEGPIDLANSVREAIDEDGLVQQHRMEDSQAGEMQALTQEVVTSEGSSEDWNVLPKSARKKKPASLKELYANEQEVWVMKPSASPLLKRLHEALATLGTEKEDLSKTLGTQFGASTLTLRHSPGLGYICHVKGKDMKLDLSTLRSVSSSKSTKSFHHPEWTHLGERIDQCKIHIRAEEQRVFNDLREQVIHNIVKLRRNAAVLDEIDIACSFAGLAAERHWTRPILNQTQSHKIVGGRHPTVEGGLEEEGRTFVANDCFVGDAQQTWFITGPNMAGKSTFLRQNALITILAQIGSYVPAEYAELGIVDQIFSRVGSADNLYKDQSTFMVEMLETATILKQATPRSFVIMDEIGRGTTASDGTAVAFACLHHLNTVNKCRTLFATHFHDLADLLEADGINSVGFYCTDVQEDREGGGFRYVHKLKAGVNKQSHALKVARLAGLPEEAIAAARRVLEKSVESV